MEFFPITGGLQNIKIVISHIISVNLKIFSFVYQVHKKLKLAFKTNNNL